jgi:hypothetical protein
MLLAKRGSFWSKGQKKWRHKLQHIRTTLSPVHHTNPDDSFALFALKKNRQAQQDMPFRLSYASSQSVLPIKSKVFSSEPPLDLHPRKQTKNQTDQPTGRGSYI